MSERYDQEKAMREAQVARDEEHAGEVEGDWEDFFDGDADEELL